MSVNLKIAIMQPTQLKASISNNMPWLLVNTLDFVCGKSYYPIFDKLTANSKPITDYGINAIELYQDEGIQTIDQCCYGKPLTAIKPSDFVRQFEGFEVFNAFDNAILNLLIALPDDHLIMLYWH